ncbi:uncharacterized protein LOC135366646 [Ornithodoros turicata]|uniref:uncharacterized protein LOC135366646 n=1 Tax=Ornithodoros turicata TaxID=34597 RepID=UPI003138B4B2
MLFCCRANSELIKKRGKELFDSVTNSDDPENQIWALEFIRCHPTAFGKAPEDTLRYVVGLLYHEQTRLATCAFDASGALLSHYHMQVRDHSFDVLMSAFHLLTSHAAPVREKALHLTVLLLGLEPMSASRELLYLVRKSERLQVLGTMVAFRRAICRSKGVQDMPLADIYNLYAAYVEESDDDLLKTEGMLGLDVMKFYFR